MIRGDRVWIPQGDVALEGLRWVPEGATAAPGVVLCHPHPLHGGNMKNSVVAAVWEALGPLGFALLRFNFRGVGRSGGEYDDGVGEVDDVLAALSFLSATPGVDPKRLAVAGYSFGAWTGGRAALRREGIEAVVLIAPPLEMWPMEELQTERRPQLAIVGDRDEYCSAAVFQKWFEGVKPPKEAVILPGVDHFFGGREGDIGEAVARFLVQVEDRTEP